MIKYSYIRIALKTVKKSGISLPFTEPPLFANLPIFIENLTCPSLPCYFIETSSDFGNWKSRFLVRWNSENWRNNLWKLGISC